MGRAEERRKAKQFAKKGKSMQEKLEVYDRLKRDVSVQATDKAMAQALEIFVSTAVIALHDKFGFGKQRLDKFIHETSEQMECIFAKTVTQKEIVELAREISGKPIDWREWYEAKWGESLDQ